jgi:hypothetical protein
MTFDAIGHQLGISSQRAGRIFHDALAAIPRQGVDEFRAEETELIDHAVNSLTSIATDSNTSARTRVEAWSAIRGWAKRKARLLGLDGPTKHAVLTLYAQIAALEAELGLRASLEEGPSATPRRSRRLSMPRDRRRARTNSPGCERLARKD